MRILILDGDGNAGCAVLQSLGAAGHECWLAAKDTKHAAFASRHVARAQVYPDPLLAKAAFQRWILQAQRRHVFALIVPSTECTVMPLHELRDDPVLAGVLAIAPAGAVDIAFDKERVLRLAAGLGIPTPSSRLVERVETLDDPAIASWLEGDGAVVVKGVRSKVWQGERGSEHPVRVTASPVELRELAQAMLPITPLQVQQWVPGHGVGIELLVDRGRIALAFAHERVHELPLTGGGSSYRRAIAPPPALLDDAARLVGALGWHGVAMVEFRADARSARYWLMEINGRFWGSLPLARFAGVDFPKALVELLLAGCIGEQPVPRTGVYARNVARDLQWMKAVFRCDPADRFLLTRPLPRSVLEWARVLVGRETWDGASWRDPGPIVFELARIVRQEVAGVVRQVRRRALLRRQRASSRSLARRIGGRRKVLVLCHGNICRSAYAEARLQAGARPHHLEVRSAGFHPVVGRSVPEPFQRIAERRGVGLDAHRSKLATLADLAWADLIVLMDQKNHDALASLDRRTLAKTLWLGALDTGPTLEIEDPYNRPAAATEAILDRLDRCLDRLAAALAADRSERRLTFEQGG
jgi:protein-tyrosine-phosphatase/predicted ATP-grasp superfamily ATP-dependent carboligase